MHTNEYEIIDVHIHLFRSIEHEKAAIKRPGRSDSDHWGYLEAITPFMDRNGIAKAVFLNLFRTKELTEAASHKLSSTLTREEQAKAEDNIRRNIADRIRRHNQWACSVGRQQVRLVPFIGIQKMLGVRGMAEEVAM